MYAKSLDVKIGLGKAVAPFLEDGECRVSGVTTTDGDVYETDPVIASRMRQYVLVRPCMAITHVQTLNSNHRIIPVHRKPSVMWSIEPGLALPGVVGYLCTDGDVFYE